jgi:hypothetical protein
MNMSDSKHQAMIIPKGAKIVTSGGGDISIDVQGDLILQENQQGLTSLVSHQGSILIDDGVQVHADKVESRHMIRVKGSLTIDHLTAEAVNVDGGTLKCNSIESGQLEGNAANVNAKSIKCQEVKLKGGTVEIGSIKTHALTLKNDVKGSVLIANAVERKVDDTVKLKGGFESDVELLGYLMKYRHEVLSERVVRKLKESEADDLQKVLLESPESPSADLDVEATVSEPEEDVFETPEVGEEDFTAADLQEEQETEEREVTESEGDGVSFDQMQKWAEKLENEIKESQNKSAVLKLIVTGLRQGDTDTLKTIFTRWKNNVEEEKKSVSEDMRETLADIEYRMSE